MAPDFEAGRYRLQERLNPDSETWTAEDLEDPTSQVVIKLLAEGADAIAARHVIETLRKTDSPVLNLPVDQGELPDGRPFLVYPWVDGPTLREYLNTSGPLPLPLAGSLISQIASGLGALHRIRIVYGLLAPEHVIIRHTHVRHQAVLLDTGIFRVSGRTSASPGYLAPEQLAGQPTLASDVFSLGALAAEMLTGRRAFRYGSLNELQRLQRIGLARGSLRKLRSKIPLRAEEEIRRATSWDPAQRPSDVAVFGSRLAELLGASDSFPLRRAIILGLLGLTAGAATLRRCRRTR